MSWALARTPQPGDWIKTTKRVKVGFTDYLLGDDAGIPPGTRGVITDVRGILNPALTARLDRGLLGPLTVRLRANQVRVIRRSGGIDAFERHVDRRGAIRLGVAIALLAPTLLFIVRYLAAGGTGGGLLHALLNGVFYGALDMLEYVLTNPLNGLIYCTIVWVAGRVAFGR